MAAEQSRPATNAERARYDRGDFSRWECPACGDQSDILGTSTLMVGCPRCHEENKLVWMRRVPMPRVEEGSTDVPER